MNIKNKLINIKKYITQNDIIIYLILALSPIIDIIYTLNIRYFNIGFPIQQVIRVIIIGYLMLCINEKRNKLISLGVFVLLIVGQIYIIFNNYEYSLLSNFSYILKILNLVFIAIVIKEKLENKSLNFNDLIKSIRVAATILSCNIIISNVFKVGLKTYSYGNRNGYKGFIEAANDVTIVLLMMLPIIVYNYIKLKRKVDIILSIMVGISLLLIGPKAGKFLLVFELGLFILPYIRKIKFNNITKKIIAFITLVIALIIYTNFSNLYSNLENKMHSKGYRSIYSYVVSYRDIQTKLIDNAIADKYDISPKYIFGYGYSYANDVLHSQKVEFYSIENDFNGLIYYSGILTAAIILFFIFSLVWKIIKNDKIDFRFKYYILISIFIGIIHAFLGGHVIYSALSNTYFATILGIGACEK